jgi:hypothetical protein
VRVPGTRLPHLIVESVAHHHAPTRLELTALDPVAAIYIANLLVAEQAAETGDGNWETLDEDYLAGLGVADKLDSWRNLAAEHIRAAEAAD